MRVRIAVIVGLFFLKTADACTNILVTPKASADGTSMVAYNADSAALHGAVSHWPAGSHSEDERRQVFSWDLGKYLGEIPEAPRTYNVMGNSNCQGLVIGETTLGGLSELSNVGKDWRNGTIIDYGQLIYITLQRAATAREAIDVMADLTTKYGYASDMEGFSLTDPSGEVWYMELIGKGDFEKGSLHVALRVPDGHVVAHANQARITQFLPCDDPSTCKASKDVVAFAIKHGYWKGDADDPSFSFSDVYDPLTFSGARFCEARVWHIFRKLTDPDDFDADFFQPYAAGYNLTRRMPLSVRPKAKLTRDAVHKLMSNHFEGTFFDPSTDIGAGPEISPYRWNGLEWNSGGHSYVNERIVGTHYTAWHFVAQVRPAPVPKMLAALSWWGADDHSWSPKIPLHGGASAVHPSYDDFNCTQRDACRAAHGLPGTVTNFSFESAWWLNQIVADQVYSRKTRAAPMVAEAQAALEMKLDALRGHAEAEATSKLEAHDVAGAKAVLNAHAIAAGASATASWKELWQRLIVTFIDGMTTTLDPKDEVCGCKKTKATFGDTWKGKVVKDAGAHYRVPQGNEAEAAASAAALPHATHSKPGRDKLSIPGVAP